MASREVRLVFLSFIALFIVGLFTLHCSKQELLETYESRRYEGFEKKRIPKPPISKSKKLVTDTMRKLKLPYNIDIRKLSKYIKK